MSIYTPRGLKIRLDTKIAFTYIARLYPKYTAFQVLKTVEGIELIPGFFAFITGVYLFTRDFSHQDIALYVGIATVIGGLIIALGLFIIPFMVRIITLLSYLHGFGLFTISIIVIGLLTVGWKGTLFYFIGRYSAAIILAILELIEVKYIARKTGFPFTASERNFFNAYRLHAVRIGVTTDLAIEDGEIESGKWRLPYIQLHTKWPEVTNRFTDI